MHRKGYIFSRAERKGISSIPQHLRPQRIILVFVVKLIAGIIHLRMRDDRRKRNKARAKNAAISGQCAGF
jgi:hypothetical protein